MSEKRSKEHDKERIRPERDGFVLDNRKLVTDMADAMSRRLPREIEPEDLVSYGTIGLIEAAEKYEPERGIPFDAFARIYIRRNMIRGLELMIGIPRRLYRLRKSRGETTFLTMPLENAGNAAPMFEVETSAFEQAEERVMLERVRKAMDVLDEDERRLIENVFGRQRSIRELSREQAVSRYRMNQKLDETLTKLRERMH